MTAITAEARVKLILSLPSTTLETKRIVTKKNIFTTYKVLRKGLMATREPNVRIRELKKDRVNFVLENVDLAYVHIVLSSILFADTLTLGLRTRYGES